MSPTRKTREIIALFTILSPSTVDHCDLTEKTGTNLMPKVIVEFLKKNREVGFLFTVLKLSIIDRCDLTEILEENVCKLNPSNHLEKLVKSEIYLRF